MNGNSVMAKIAGIKNESVELATQKVSLALVDDIQKMYNAASKELSTANTASKKALAAIDEVFTAYRQNAIKANEALGKITELKKQAKDLGLEAPANVLKFEEELTANVKNSQAKMAAIQNAKKQF